MKLECMNCNGKSFKLVDKYPSALASYNTNAPEFPISNLDSDLEGLDINAYLIYECSGCNSQVRIKYHSTPELEESLKLILDE